MQGKMATTQATNLAPPGGASPGNVARAEIHGMSPAAATAAGRQAGGALMITWTAIAASWSVGVDGGIPVGMKALMPPFKSSPQRSQRSGAAGRALESAWPAPQLPLQGGREEVIKDTMVIH